MLFVVIFTTYVPFRILGVSVDHKGYLVKEADSIEPWRKVAGRDDE